MLPEEAWVALMERSLIKVYRFSNRIIAHAAPLLWMVKPNWAGYFGVNTLITLRSVLPEQAWVALMERSLIKVYRFSNRIITHALLTWVWMVKPIEQVVLESEYLDYAMLYQG
ncbi:TPA: hypothetical protein ACPSKE_001069 [Legionella feeleii]